MKTYSIFRYYRKGRHELVRTGLTREQAEKWCSDPDTCKEGVWFDGFVQE